MIFFYNLLSLPANWQIEMGILGMGKINL